MLPTGLRIDKTSSAETKIALFRSLFRGREDVFARRFENQRTGKSGYSPACGNEWVRGICHKPQIKCSACHHQKFLPVTDEAIRFHLSGKDHSGAEFVMGVYPLLQDETCYFLAMDFDKQTWREDLTAVLETCRKFALPYAVERSRSGNGGHLWLFFSSAIPANLARKLGTFLLTETMESRPDIGLDSYDRLFPNQDTLPQGGFGNLIALPLQKRPRESGNTIFLDDLLEPHSDPWMLLSSISRTERTTVEAIVADAERKGHIVGVKLYPHDDEELPPWQMTPSRQRKEPRSVSVLPRQLELVLGNQIYIPKAELASGLRNQLIRLAAFQNPEFYKAQAMRLPTWGKPRIIGCAEDFPNHLGLPRGCLEEIQSVLAEWGIESILRDERQSGRQLKVKFHGELQLGQKRAARELLKYETGVLSATTAFGKTVIAVWLIAQRKVNTLVLVHRRQLLEQWVQRLATFLDLPPNQIGQIGGGRKKPTGLLDVALIQSLTRKGVVHDCVADYGQVIIDECHHLSATSFEQVVRRAKARFVTGLSATVTRKDGHHPIIFMQCGPIRFRVNAKEQAAIRPFEHTVHVRPTNFSPLKTPAEDKRIEFQELYTELVSDQSRNKMVCDDVLHSVSEGRSPLVLTERNEHLDLLATQLSSCVQHLVVLRGGMNRKEIVDITQRLLSIPESESRIILATGKYIGEGFDDARLDTLFLTLPVSWKGTIAQYAGRLHRAHHTKREVMVYDYADLNVPMLARMFDRRCRGYEAIGYRLLLPASALPGWPAEVPLPVSPQWKQDYAASVQRLIRDGVDTPLAKLFTTATVTSPITADDHGVSRARSATEVFLFRRLQTLPQTSGQFSLNAELPIPFDDRGKMEVDFLFEAANLVIELDGSQHLSNAEAYRRDRRKDWRLQEHGYFVLRFLAEDVGRHLDDVLDVILRTLAHRLRSN